MKHVEVSDVGIAYRRAGAGPALVLLHGGMEDSRVWVRQLRGLADEFTVLAWDAPGCGRSADIPETWRLTVPVHKPADSELRRLGSR